VSGRIEKLYYKTIGEYVKKGSPVLELYSEELNNAKQEYVLALDRKKAFAGETVIDFDHLVQASKNKLLLWGMSEIQIKSLEQPGNVASTTTVYSKEDGYITELYVKEGGLPHGWRHHIQNFGSFNTLGGSAGLCFTIGGSE
jgi:Cu(I)/Ag(I) efflux system membrane fusion protein